MSTVGITTGGDTMWVCDACGAPALTPNAFTLPRGWWRFNVERMTGGGRLKHGQYDVCGKACAVHAVQFANGSLVPYVET